MKVKRFSLLVRCLCAMLCCITFLLTSITTNAANPIYTVSYTTTISHTLSYDNNIKAFVNDYVNGTPTNTYSVSSQTYSSNILDYEFVCVPSFTNSNFRSDKYYLLTGSFYVDTSSSHSGVTDLSLAVNSIYYDWNGNRIEFGRNSSSVKDFTCYVKGSDLYNPVNGSFNFWGGTFHVNMSIWGRAVNTSENYAYNKITLNFQPVFYCNFQEISKSVYQANESTSRVSDSGTQNAINNQTEKVEQGNTIAQENSNTNKDTNNKITDFFGSFFDNLIHIFVPEDGFFSQWFNSLNDFMAQKLGFLWSPFNFMLSFLNGVYSGSGSASLVFPELSWIDGTVIIPRTEFSFDNIGGESFQDLRDMIYFATDVILLGAVISQFYKKIKLVFEGGGD